MHFFLVTENAESAEISFFFINRGLARIVESIMEMAACLPGEVTI